MLPDHGSESAVIHRPDIDLLEDVRGLLRRDSQIRALDHGNVAVEVRDGIAYLSGHVASAFNREAAGEIAASVPGVAGVRNDLVADAELSVAISQALAADARTRACSIVVDAFHGWISLLGEAPSMQARDACLEVAIGVTGVRGVLALPDVAGTPPSQTREALQPRIGAAVYATDGWAGRVTSVASDPRDRLVSHLIVSARFDLDGQTVTGTYVVPMEAVHNLSDSGVFLADSYRQLAARPALDASQFSKPPAGWKPPFPYTLESTLVSAPGYGI